MVPARWPLKEPKTRRSSRNLTLWDQAVAVLKQQRARQNEIHLKMGPAYRDHDFVFASADGSPLDPQAVRRHFGNLLVHASLPRIRFHDLRHTHATLLLSEDEHPKVGQ
jgi:integrase